MKKELFYYLAGILSLTLSGCCDEHIASQQSEKELGIIQATTAEVTNSRAHLATNNCVFWDSQDVIGIYSDIQNTITPYKYVSSTDENAIFSPQQTTVKGNKFYAIYPYNTFFSAQKNMVTMEIPANQSYYPDSFDPYNCPMVAQSTDGNFHFLQTTGIVRLKLSGSIRVEKITLQGNNQEKICGPGTINIGISEPTFSLINEHSGTSITMKPSNIKLSEIHETSFHFIIPAQTFSKGLTFTISGTKNDGTPILLTKRTEKSITVNRSVISSFTSIDVDEELNTEDISEKEALIALYKATNGDNWSNHTNWCTDKPLSEWFGLTVSNNHVTSINLPWNNLDGEIPDEFFSLSKLFHLNFEGNQLTGDLPLEISKWVGLRFLGLSNNHFTGSIPATFSCLTNLTYFSLESNELTGTIPAELKEMPNWSSVIKNRLEPQLPGYGFTYPATVNMISLGQNLYLHPEGYALELRLNEKRLLTIDEIKETTKHIYEQFNDRFDFINFIYNVLNPNELGVSIAAEFGVINNTIEGIGAYPVNTSAEYSSNGTLKGFIVTYSHNGLGAIIHELGHYWGAMQLGQETIDNSGKGMEELAHWGISNVNGLLGGFDEKTLERNVDGNPKKYKAASSIGEQYGYFAPQASGSQYYAPIELYLMGLIPKEEVPDILLFKDVWGTSSENPLTNGIFYAEREETITIDDIIARYGERKPSYQDSQKSFRMLTLVITNNPVNDKEWKNIIDMQTLLEAEKGNNGTISFKEATKGKASIKITGIDEERK